MTQQDLIERATRAALPTSSGPTPGGKPVELGPIALAILSAVLAAVVGEIVERCADKLVPTTVLYPGPVTRFRLRRLCRRAVLAAATQHAACGLSASDPRSGIDLDAIESRAYEGLLCAGKSLTVTEMAALRMGR